MQLLVNNRQESEVLNPTGHEELNVGSVHITLEADPSPVEPQIRLQLWLTFDYNLVRP